MWVNAKVFAPNAGVELASLVVRLNAIEGVAIAAAQTAVECERGEVELQKPRQDHGVINESKPKTLKGRNSCGPGFVRKLALDDEGLR